MKFFETEFVKKSMVPSHGAVCRFNRKTIGYFKSLYVALREEVICKRLLQNPFCSKYRGSLHIISIGMCQSSKNQLMY